MEEFIQRSASADRHIKSSGRFRQVGGGGSKEVGLDDIGHIGEVSGSLTVAIDVDRFASQHGGNPRGNDCRIGALGILARSEYVEIAETGELHSVALRECLGVGFGDGFRSRVGREEMTGLGFDLGKAGFISVDGTRRRVDHSLDAGFLRCRKKVECSGSVGSMAGNGILDGARDRSQGALMKDVIRAAAGFQAGVEICEISDEGGQSTRSFRRDGIANRIEVLFIASGEIVETGYFLV